MELSDTDGTKVIFGKNAVLDIAEPIITTIEQSNKGRYYMVVRSGDSKQTTSFYYNSDTEKRKNAYQVMNRILAEG